MKPKAKPVLSSQATAKKHASIKYASVEVKEPAQKKPALSSEASAKKHASVGYALIEVNENVGKRPRLSSEALIDKPVSMMDDGPDAVASEGAAPKPELSSLKTCEKVPARPSIPRPQDSLKVRASLEKPQEESDRASVEVVQRPSVPRRQGSLAYTPPKVDSQYDLSCLTFSCSCYNDGYFTTTVNHPILHYRQKLLSYHLQRIRRNNIFICPDYFSLAFQDEATAIQDQMQHAIDSADVEANLIAKAAAYKRLMCG